MSKAIRNCERNGWATAGGFRFLLMIIEHVAEFICFALLHYIVSAQVPSCPHSIAYPKWTIETKHHRTPNIKQFSLLVTCEILFFMWKNLMQFWYLIIIIIIIIVESIDLNNIFERNWTHSIPNNSVLEHGTCSMVNISTIFDFKNVVDVNLC